MRIVRRVVSASAVVLGLYVYASNGWWTEVVMVTIGTALIGGIDVLKSNLKNY